MGKETDNSAPDTNQKNPRKKIPDDRQSQAFIEAARELGCDEDESHFVDKLKKVARHKPADGDKPDKQPSKKEVEK